MREFIFYRAVGILGIEWKFGERDGFDLWYIHGWFFAFALTLFGILAKTRDIGVKAP